MMKIAKFGFTLLVPILILFVSCKQEQEFNTETIGKTDFLQFASKKYDFSFSYPYGWGEITRDLPDKWALMDKNKNTILFIVNRAQGNDLLALGRSQALRDLYNENNISNLKRDDVKKIFEIVKLEYFNNQSWYTYGIKFSDKNVNSLVSGTLCEDNEITLVLVNDFLSFDKNKEAYSKILNTFEC